MQDLIAGHTLTVGTRFPNKSRHRGTQLPFLRWDVELGELSNVTDRAPKARVALNHRAQFSTHDNCKKGSFSKWVISQHCALPRGKVRGPHNFAALLLHRIVAAR